MTPHLTVDEPNRLALEQLADGVEDMLDAWQEFSRRTNWTPPPEIQSAFEDETVALAAERGPAGPWKHPAVKQILGHAFVLLFGAGQNLYGCAALLRSTHVGFSLAPVVRAVMEACGRVAWLLDPRETLRVRAARYFLIEIDEAARAKRLAGSMGLMMMKSQKGRFVRHLQNQDLGNRFFPSEIVKDRSTGKLTLLGQQVPGFGEAVATLGKVNRDPEWNLRGLYDFLSTATHPTVFTALELLNFDAPGDELATINASQPDAHYSRALTSHAVHAFLLNWQLIASYHGLDVPEMPQIRTDLHALLDPGQSATSRGSTPAG